MGLSNRIIRWREWRQGLDAMQFEDALTEINRTWWLAPRVNHYLAPDESSKWPTPWELISDNHYCDLSIALGMFYSLQLSGHAHDHAIDLSLYKDPMAQRWIHLCRVDGGKYILNWDNTTILNTPTLPREATLAHRYNKIDLAKQLG